MKKSYDKNRGILPLSLFAFLFISGVFAGSAIAALSEITIDFNLPKPDRIYVFISSFKSFLKPCIIIWLSGFTGASVYISALVLAYRGGVFGFVISALLKTYGLPGGLLKAICMGLPQNIIYLPFLLFVCLACAKQYKKPRASSIILLLVSISVCALCALTDTYITSALISFTFR